MRSSVRLQNKSSGANQPAKDKGNSKTEHAVEKLLPIQHGSVIFNHFICTKTKLRPSLLIKAWNRGAAIMIKPCTKGIDFMIPVMLASPNKNLGLRPLFGEWTEAQERAGSRIIAHVLINAKNDFSMTDTDIRMAAEKCHPTLRNFNHYKCVNPFISLVLSFDTESFQDTPVKMYPPINKTTPQLKIGARVLTGRTYNCL
jgi:hypothetical protein